MRIIKWRGVLFVPPENDKALVSMFKVTDAELLVSSVLAIVVVGKPYI